MALSVSSFLGKTIEYLFYALFAAVPFAFSGVNFELFEFNKMWLTFILTVLIGTAWFCRMIINKQFKIQRTPLDIPIVLFFLSLFISTIFSLDTHVSVWGYYSRFNGGLLSFTSYIFLYYAFVTNFPKEHLMRLLKIILFGGLAVALWGLPSHFGYDPTCYLFRGTLDVSCWTESFQPMIRIFSTLGQPNWLAAYLAILIPLTIAMGIKGLETPNKSQRENRTSKIESRFLTKLSLASNFYFLLSIIFFLTLLFTKSQSGFLGLVGGLGIFSFLYFMGLRTKEKQQKTNVLFQKKLILLIILIVTVFSFFLDHPVTLFDFQKYTTFSGIKSTLSNSSDSKITKPQGPSGELGGTDSFTIRKLVWKGAIDIWKHYPLFGSGVETFAYSYYKFRPQEHNLTSEWDYLYNKAHNEYLNYLATTGIVGLGTYLLIVVFFLYLILKNPHSISLPSLGLLAGFVTILISNIPGFSVVIVNIFFFLIPALVFKFEGKINTNNVLHIPTHLFFPFSKKSSSSSEKNTKQMQIIWVSLVIVTSLFMLYNLIVYWYADKAYGSGYNLTRAGEYQEAFSALSTAVLLRRDEPTFLDELSYTTGVLSVALSSENESTSSAEFAKEAIRLSDIVVTEHPENVVFWKTRVRLLYALSQIDSSYTPLALTAIQRANTLAPTDAKVSYNLALIYGQAGDTKKAIKTLEETIKLKPDYKDAYFAIALFYRDEAVDKNDRVVNTEMQKKAVGALRHILTILDPTDEASKKTLKEWGEIL